MRNQCITLRFSTQVGNYKIAEDFKWLKVEMVRLGDAGDWRVPFVDKQAMNVYPKLAGMQARTDVKLAKKIIKYVNKVNDSKHVPDLSTRENVQRNYNAFCRSLVDGITKSFK